MNDYIGDFYTCLDCAADHKYIPYTAEGLLSHRRIAHTPWYVMEEEPG